MGLISNYALPCNGTETKTEERFQKNSGQIQILNRCKVGFKAVKLIQELIISPRDRFKGGKVAKIKEKTGANLSLSG